MSALGQKQTCAVHQPMSALLPIATAKADLRKTPCLLHPLKADAYGANRHVCFGPKADMCIANGHVGFTPIATKKADSRKGPDQIQYASSSGQEPDGSDEDQADCPQVVEIDPASREELQTEPAIDKERNHAAGSHHRESMHKRDENGGH